ncbi:beta-phosphoglucomutase [Mucilaginibacter pallidiroseus]|uniref:Beta-phosphoglucomutase n=1 Tax=Mucilaginibacter pallidiroseus TaxID=2599295 RepID=A0A563U3D7_9SPHI|nr:beta-phosphoglucomutase [Mucilaginibacter pallidiroseus]TWR25850.1 beta-phosphoglucomutase [Mucilaginibacter pallidiroseus]
MENIQACIFDLDGVIVDTAVYHYKAWKRLANTLGFDFTEHQNEQLKGVSRMASLELILGWGGINGKTEEEKLAMATQKNEWYTEMINKMTPAEILPGAREFVESCRAAAIKTAIGSASKNTLTILNKLELTPLFDAVIDGNSVNKPKPDPEVFIKGAEALNARPSQCIVFEDAMAGIEAAIAGGMKTVGIGSADTLALADVVVTGLDKVTLEMLTSI